MTKDRYFHFSLGPVQEFVGKARRLRDYWTGSYLLSYLTEQAMDEICEKDGEVIFPPYKGKGDITRANKGLEIGSFPNRFQATVPSNFDPSCCEKRVRDAWEEIADYIWDKYISEVAPLGKGTKEIWDRQVKGFWYMQWVLADEENDALLDIRKNWRNYVPTVEPGDKCTLFGNLQEISGYVRTSKKAEREKQKIFWEKMRSKLYHLDLKEGERLSAVALIKRLFPRAYNELKGTQFPESFPSTTYMSAISWMEKVIKKDRKLVVDFLRDARKIKGYGSEAKAGIRCLEELAGEDKELKDFISLDGNFFYSHTLLNDKLWDDKDRAIREELERKVKEISDKVGFKPGTYYALLSMDGDNMGAILQKYKDRKEKISNKISAFSHSVPDIIRKHDGRVIYAGGEDVFAILPVNTAIDAAVELKTKYTELLEPVLDSKNIGTISGAIIFAHHHAPLNKLYSEIQSLLDNKAKDECGRASLAISTWTTGGPDLVWAMPWDEFVKDTGDNLLSELAKCFGKTKETESISSGFIYNMRRDFALIELEYDDSVLGREEILKLLTAEYIRAKSRGDKSEEMDEEKVRKVMGKLLEICTKYYRDENGDIKMRQGLNIDGALLIRFLARRWHRDNQNMGV